MPLAQSATSYPMTFGARTQRYDAYGHIASIAYPTGFMQNAYSYDAAGNPLSYRAIAPSIPTSAGGSAFPTATRLDSIDRMALRWLVKTRKQRCKSFVARGLEEGIRWWSRET